MNSRVKGKVGAEGRTMNPTRPSAAPPGAVLLTKAQIAVALQVSVRTINTLMRRGEVPFVKVGPWLVRFRLEDVQRRLNESVPDGVRAGQAREGQGYRIKADGRSRRPANLNQENLCGGNGDGESQMNAIHQ